MKNSGNVLITGGTSGLGLELVKLFLKNGYNVAATGRQLLNLSGYKEKFKLFRIDFSDMNQVAFITKKICETYDLNIVINNAGILSPPDFTHSISGYEYTLQVNYLSHLLIDEIILREIRDDRPVKIATVTSPVYRLADADLKIHTEEQVYSAVKAYASSKLYLTMMCEFLPARYPGLNLQCISFDPGTFSSRIYRTQKKWFRGMYRIASPFMRSPGKVAKILYEILIEKDVENGKIYDIKKHIRQIPVRDEKEKVVFRKACYDIIDPFLA